MAQVLQIIGVVIEKTIKYWGMPLLCALLWLGINWLLYGTLVWLEAVLVFVMVSMVNYVYLSKRTRPAGKYSHVVN